MKQTPTMDSLELESPLWQFASAFWRTPDAAQVCLALQDKGWDVTRVLCSGWLAAHGLPFQGEPSEVTDWRYGMTQRLRAMKQTLPKEVAGLSGLRTKLAATELEAERVELALAFSALSPEVANNTTADNTTVPASSELFRRNLYAAAPESITIDRETERLIESITNLLICHSAASSECAQ